MANKKKVTITYDIVDESGSTVDASGNPYGVRQYSGIVDENGTPQGGSLFVDAYNARKNNKTPQVYQDPTDSELWTSKNDAKVSIGVATDGQTADIIITGPKWYADQVKNSDWFKDNYDNNAFRKLVQAYVNNPNGSMVDPSDDSKSITYAEAFQRYSDAFGETAEAYKELAKLKDNIEGAFGVQLNDNQALIAATSLNKDDYTSNAAVYIPKWLSEKHDFSQYESWNSENRTISAEDFFKNYYSTANWDKNGIQEAKDLARRELRTQGLYGTGVSLEDRELKAKLKDENYKDEVARTISIAQIMGQNDAESDFGMDMAMFATGFATGFFEKLGEFAVGLNQTLTDIMKFPIDQIHDFARDVWGFSDEDAQGFAITANLPAAVVYTGLSALGEVYNAASHADMEYISKGLEQDLKDIADLSGRNAWSEVEKEYQAGMNAFWQSTGDLSKSVEAGRFIGGVAYKIVENIVLLNALGGKVGKLISGGAKAGTAVATGTAASAAEAAALSTTAKATGFFSIQGLSTAFKALVASGNISPVSAFLETMGFAANVGIQGVIETLVDDSNTFHALMANGDQKVVEVLWQNVGYNAMGEFMGWGATKIGQTAPAKLVKGGLRKATNAAGEVRYNMTLSAMKKIFGENPSNAKVASKMKFLKLESEMAGDIVDVKMTKGIKELGFNEAVTKNYAEQQALTNIKIRVENAYDAMNASVKQGMAKVQKELDPDTVKAFYDDAKAVIKTDDALVNAGRLTKSEIPGNKLSQEASDYLSYNQRSINLKNTIDMAASNGAKASAEDIEELEVITAKMDSLRMKLGNEYATQLDAFYDKIAGFQYQLNRFKLDNQLFTDLDERAQQLSDMQSGKYGEDGKQYIHTERGFKDENYAERFIKGGDKPRSAKAGKRLGKDIDEHFVDPTTMLFLDLSKTGSLMVQHEWQEALAMQGGAYKNIIVTEEEKILADHFSDMRAANLAAFSVNSEANTPLSKTIREAFDKNDVIGKSYNRTKAAKETAQKAKTNLDRGNKAINRVINMDNPGTFGQTIYKLQPEDFEEINAGLKSAKIPSYDFNNMRAADFQQWYDNLGTHQKGTLDYALKKAGKNVNVTNARDYMRKNPYLRRMMQQSYILDNPKIMKTRTFQQVIYGRRVAELNARNASTLFDNIAKVEESQEILDAGKVKFDRSGKVKDVSEPGAITGEIGKAYADGVHATTNDIIDSMHEFIVGNESSQLIIDEFVKAGVDQDVAVRYVALHNLKNISKGDIKKAIMSSNFASKQIKEAASNAATAKKVAAAAAKGKTFTGTVKGKTLLETYENYVNNTAEAVYKDIQSEYNDCLKSLSDRAPVEPGEVYGRVEEYVRDLGVKLSPNNVVAYPDVAAGKINYIEVDPVVADLYNLRPGSFNLTMDDYGTGAQHVIGFFNKLNRLFQWGTTGFSLTSFVNQWWRDSYNAVVVGGARPFLDFGVGAEAADNVLGRRVAGHITKKYIARYGKQTVTELQEMLGADKWARFVAEAEKSGLTMEEAAVRYVVRETGYGMLPNQEQLTTVGYYMSGRGNVGAKYQSEAMKLQNELLENVQTRLNSLFAKDGAKQSQTLIERAMDAISKKQLGTWREVTLRQNVYASAYGRALDSGMCVSDAQQYATRFALDATTDFARPLMIGDSIAKSVPYFGAAVNGVESFYRLLEIDPAGVAGRFIGGIILPGIEAISQTLSDEEDRKIYMNIPEYDKEDSLVFVTHGEVISIPLPQEISGFFAPFRQAVEAAYDANDKSWVDLISADILGVSPVDLSGFVDLDYNELLGEPSFVDRIARGTEKAMSQLLPAAAKSAYMAISGRDPYTGRSIDRSYTYTDDDGIHIMDSTQSEFAQWFSKQFGGEISPSSAAAIFKNLLGRAGMNLADAIVTTIAKNPGEGALQLASRSGEGALGVMSPDVYNKARSEWNSAVSQLEKERTAIQGSKSYQSLQQKISFETDPEKLKKLYAESDEVTYKYQSKVCAIVDNLNKKYPGMYNRSRQAAVISLLNMNSYITGGKSGYARSLSQELYYQGRQNAIATMQALGFTSVQDNSILGYGKMVGNEYEFVYNDPLVIMNMGNIVYGQANINKANLEAILKANDITRGEMYGDEWRSLKTKAEKQAYKKEWNKKVITLLAPYITRHGVDSVLSDFETKDFLDNYLFIDNPYKTKDYLYSVFGGAQ